MTDQETLKRAAEWLDAHPAAGVAICLVVVVVFVWGAWRQTFGAR